VVPLDANRLAIEKILIWLFSASAEHASHVLAKNNGAQSLAGHAIGGGELVKKRLDEHYIELLHDDGLRVRGVWRVWGESRQLDQHIAIEKPQRLPRRIPKRHFRGAVVRD
jgi:hypothetical protein